MSLDQQQFRRLISHVLVRFNEFAPGVYSDRAVELLMGTAAQESHLGRYLYQVRGPAIGFFQMEPDTLDSLWEDYIRFRPRIAAGITAVSGYDGPDQWALETSLAYQIAMARVRYLPAKPGLPAADDLFGMGWYWDKYYNRNPEKGFVEDFVASYKEYCL